jgi:hypothetical protein
LSPFFPHLLFKALSKDSAKRASDASEKILADLPEVVLVDAKEGRKGFRYALAAT